MKFSVFFRRIFDDSKVRAGGAVTMRTIVCALFIALVALFFTSPASEHSAYDKPLPLPAELGLE
ncbi:MAG: hypothetical protein ABIT83_19725 [Massilia sp.]